MIERLVYEAAARLSDAERKHERGAFWGSIHGTLNHLLWADRIWMSRFDGWPPPPVPQKESAAMIADFATLKAEREAADAKIDARFHSLNIQITMIKWLMGMQVAATLAIVWALMRLGR